jgi:hypothetical protein
MVDLHYQGRLIDRGFACQEQVSLGEFLGNRFGKVYGTGSFASPVPQFSGRVS